MTGSMASIASALDGDVARIASAVRRGMVRVICRGKGVGAGTVWHPEGLVLTNAHVAADRNLKVEDAKGERYSATLIAADRKLDLAALSVKASGLDPIKLGSTTAMRPGELVFAMGFPLGVDGGFTAGVFIGLETWTPGRGGMGRKWIMASLHLRPGHSGGPMVNSKGHLIGINTIMRGPDVGAAIPIEVVKRFLRKSMTSFQIAA